MRTIKEIHRNSTMMIFLQSLFVAWRLVTLVAALPATEVDNREDILLDVEELSKFGDTDKSLAEIRRLAVSLHGCGVKEIPDLKRVELKNKTVTCNDGSPAGYYIRKSYGSSRWIVFLEGGWYCFDLTSCHARWVNRRSLMTSRIWPDTRKGSGILSWDPEENPNFFTANMVMIPYCSSDTWSGTVKAKNKGDFSFMGALILEEVIKELVTEHGMNQAKTLLLAGSSAGGLGVFLNVDRVANVVGKMAPGVDVRGISDSGWFLDNKQFKPSVCVDVHNCAPTEGIKKGMQLWQGQVPQTCKDKFQDEPWRCYFGHRLYPYVKTPVFIIQYLFDEAQITADNVGPPLKKEQWHFIHELGNDLKNSLHNTSAVFASACLSHIVLTKPGWHKMTIEGVSLSDALQCWVQGSYEPNYYLSRILHSIGKKGEDNLLGDDPTSTRIKNRKNKRRKGKKRRRCKNCRKNRRNRKNRKTKNEEDNFFPEPRRERSTILDHHYRNPKIEQHHLKHHSNQCRHHLIDTCAWPQCNLSCPKLMNPFTGEEVDFIDLIKQFGLDLSSIANALGIDLATLQTMDHDHLLQLLTEQG